MSLSTVLTKKISTAIESETGMLTRGFVVEFWIDDEILYEERSLYLKTDRLEWRILSG